jgi:hypothetical protein
LTCENDGMSERQLRHYEAEDGTWTVAESGTWLPGIYESKAVATAAADLPDARLARLLNICHVEGEDRTITAADVERAATL